MAKLIVGLGNIGKEYEKTNHNMGFMVIDELCTHFAQNCTKKECESLISCFNFQGERIILAKPTTFMNLSGNAVKSLVKKYAIDIKKDLIIISDDIDLEPSKIRIRSKGSAGTHNGLKSVIEKLQTNEFARVRVGVGKPPEFMDLADFVLSPFKDKEGISNGIEKAKDAILMFIEGEKLDNIMQKFN